MRKIIVSLTVIAIVAAIAIGATMAYFGDAETSNGNTFTTRVLDMKIKDGDESWGDGVVGTWVAEDVKPGDEYAFLAPLIMLSKTYKSINADHLEITSDYSVIEENPCIESDTDCQTNLHPDEMAKEILITRCVYRDDICIDCLTGKKYDGYDTVNQVCTGINLGQSDDWKIEDKNGDGKISFYDLNQDKLDNLPPVPNTPFYYFEMGVKFDDDAGNDLQGDIFDLTMIFTLNQDASQ